MDLAQDLLRTVILFVGITLFLACVKFAWLAIRNGEAYRAWGLMSYGLIVVTPAVIGLGRYEQNIAVVAMVTYVTGLVCGIMALRKVYTVNPEWTRLRLAEERRRRHAATGVRRAEEDTLRADDRVSQAEERADSRAMADAATPEDDARAEFREAQDDNREHSHDLQDDERAKVRDDEDRRDR